VNPAARAIADDRRARRQKGRTMSGPPDQPGLAQPVSRAEFLDDVLDGLSRTPRSLPGKYLWDETGSLLFDRICESHDYYLTHRELGLLRNAAPEVAQVLGPGASLVEFGSGASVKSRVVLDALADPRRYIPVDIADEHLRAAAERIARDYPGLEVVPVHADYTKPLSLPAAEEGRPVLGFFPGSTIGNFAPDAAVAFLRRVRAALGPSWFLLGADPNRDEASLARAYADGEGLMAALHGNLLTRIARELGGELDPAAFRHEARVRQDPPRVEAHLVARWAAACRVGGRTFQFAPGESIHTDTSYKYAPETFRGLAADAGWEPVRCWLDEDGFCALHLLRG
jgi:dimethylhistidine N-methyltransferase